MSEPIPQHALEEKILFWTAFSVAAFVYARLLYNALKRLRRSTPDDVDVDSHEYRRYPGDRTFRPQERTESHRDDRDRQESLREENLKLVLYQRRLPTPETFLDRLPESGDLHTVVVLNRDLRFTREQYTELAILAQNNATEILRDQNLCLLEDWQQGGSRVTVLTIRNTRALNSLVRLARVKRLPVYVEMNRLRFEAIVIGPARSVELRNLLNPDRTYR
ncbi:hypothetical protein M8J76_015263 [Diaphorina citri]|nr:hypothetical protein M8J76_015263 [Diaphorina citri]